MAPNVLRQNLTAILAPPTGRREPKEQQWIGHHGGHGQDMSDQEYNVYIFFGKFWHFVVVGQNVEQCQREPADNKCHNHTCRKL